MSQPKPSNYFESKVMTASPPQLHLMLIEGALRFCMKAQQNLAKENEGHANEAMMRAIDIIGEMLAGVRGGTSDINQKLSELYLFLFQTLTSAYVNTDPQKLADVMRILEFERETWQLACERVAKDEAAASPKAEKTPVVAAHLATPNLAEQGGVSFEA